MKSMIYTGILYDMNLSNFNLYVYIYIYVIYIIYDI